MKDEDNKKHIQSVLKKVLDEQQPSDRVLQLLFGVNPWMDEVIVEHVEDKDEG